MSTVLVPLPDGRWLRLTEQAFADALAAGDEAMKPKLVARDATGDVRLVTAEQAAAALEVDASWLLQRARLNKVPHVRLGKYVRFDLREVQAALTKGTG